MARSPLIGSVSVNSPGKKVMVSSSRISTAETPKIQLCRRSFQASPHRLRDFSGLAAGTATGVAPPSVATAV